MKEMIQARKEQLEARGVSGFTLMEMLIVVAIIAVLIAIAIPVFTTQLNKSKEAADSANARSVYALFAANYMTNGTVVYPSVNGTTPISGTPVTVKSISVTYGGTTFAFSDVADTITFTGGIGDTSPSISLVTNGTTYNFG